MSSAFYFSFYFVHTFRHKTTLNASDILNRTYQAQGALIVANKNKNKITTKVVVQLSISRLTGAKPG